MKKFEEEFGECSRISRREVFTIFGSLGAMVLVNLVASNDARADERPAHCVLTPQLTEGPFFIDEHLNRSNVVEGQQGLPLKLDLTVYNANSCVPLPGVQIDIWHANALGVYSDIAGLGSSNQRFLRGYQVTDREGKVSFATIYPGWYPGRTPHIHLKARISNAAGNKNLEATTQLFFDDAVTDSVYGGNAPYNTRSARHTRNSEDGIYGGQSGLLAVLKGSATSGYTGTFAIGMSA
jgi:protocatechuate 3,4-dioxygenase beta subunit